MILSTLISNSISSSGVNWAAYWKSRTDLFLFFAETKNISGGKLYNQMAGASDYLTVSGESGNEIYQAPNTSDYKNADTDYFWFNANGTLYSVTTEELISYDLSKTIVKYQNDTPYSIEAIAIIKNGVTLTETQINRIHKDFSLSYFWSGEFNENGYLKGNRTLTRAEYNAPSVTACDYGDTYVTNVVADGGVIISRRMVDLEYQRLIDTGHNMNYLWYAYHYKCGVKKSTVNYGGTNYEMVSKWYNLSPASGRFAASVAAYSTAPGTDARAEYTSYGLRFRPTNLDGGTRCGLETSASVLTNNNNIVKQRAILIPLANGYPNTKGYNDNDSGYIRLIDVATTRKLGLEMRTTGANITRPSDEDNVFANSTEVEVEATVLFTSPWTITGKKNGTSLTFSTPATNAIYPAYNYADCVGCSRNSGRTPYNGYIKAIEFWAL